MSEPSVTHLRNRFAGLLLFVLPFLLSVAGTAAAEFSPETPIKILTFNIMWEEAGVRAGNLSLPVWKERNASVVSLITNATADIVGIQEASPEQQLGLQAELPDYTLVFHAATNNTNPILFKTRRFRLLESGAFVLNDEPEIEGTNIGIRSSTWAHLQDRSTQRDLWIYNLHLDHRSKGPTRQISAVRLVERMNDHSGAVFVTGDFNTSESSPTMTFFYGKIVLKNDSGESVTNPKPLVNAYRLIHPKSPQRLIDHVLVGPDVAIRNAGRVTSGTASDHNAIWAEVLID